MALPTMLAIACRLLVGTIAFAAGAAKLGRNPSRQLQFLSASTGISDSRLVRWLLWSLPPVEMSLGLALLNGWQSRAALACFVLLCAGFVLVVQRAIRKQVSGGCGCFGAPPTPEDAPIGRSHLLFNIILLLAAAYPLMWFAGIEVDVFTMTRQTIVLTAGLGGMWAALHILAREADWIWNADARQR